jgi:hypothetical protein
LPPERFVHDALDPLLIRFRNLKRHRSFPRGALRRQ